VVWWPEATAVGRGVDRHPVLRAAGAAAAAQVDLDLPGPSLPGRDVHRAGRAGRRAAGVADRAGVPVGDRAAAPRAAPNPAAGRALAEKVVTAFPSCPIPEIARLGTTLRRWKGAFLAYFDTDGASNGGTEAVNGLIELHRRIARGFRNRDNYRLRMLLIGGGLNP
jgi:Transposase